MSTLSTSLVSLQNSSASSMSVTSSSSLISSVPTVSASEPFIGSILKHVHEELDDTATSLRHTNGANDTPALTTVTVTKVTNAQPSNSIFAGGLSLHPAHSSEMIKRATSAPPIFDDQSSPDFYSEDIRRSPAYYDYYHSQRPIDPRLPVPLIHYGLGHSHSSWQQPNQNQQRAKKDSENQEENQKKAGMAAPTAAAGLVTKDGLDNGNGVTILDKSRLAALKTHSPLLSPITSSPSSKAIAPPSSSPHSPGMASLGRSNTPNHSLTPPTKAISRGPISSPSQKAMNQAPSSPFSFSAFSASGTQATLSLAALNATAATSSTPSTAVSLAALSNPTPVIAAPTPVTATNLANGSEKHSKYSASSAMLAPAHLNSGSLAQPEIPSVSLHSNGYTNSTHSNGANNSVNPSGLNAAQLSSLANNPYYQHQSATNTAAAYESSGANNYLSSAASSAAGGGAMNLSAMNALYGLAPGVQNMQSMQSMQSMQYSYPFFVNPAINSLVGMQMQPNMSVQGSYSMLSANPYLIDSYAAQQYAPSAMNAIMPPIDMQQNMTDALNAAVAQHQHHHHRQQQNTPPTAYPQQVINAGQLRNYSDAASASAVSNGYGHSHAAHSHAHHNLPSHTHSQPHSNTYNPSHSYATPEMHSTTANPHTLQHHRPHQHQHARSIGISALQVGAATPTTGYGTVDSTAVRHGDHFHSKNSRERQNDEQQRSAGGQGQMLSYANIQPPQGTSMHQPQHAAQLHQTNVNNTLLSSSGSYQSIAASSDRNSYGSGSGPANANGRMPTAANPPSNYSQSSRRPPSAAANAAVEQRVPSLPFPLTTNPSVNSSTAATSKHISRDSGDGFIVGKPRGGSGSRRGSRSNIPLISGLATDGSKLSSSAQTLPQIPPVHARLLEEMKTPKTGVTYTLQYIVTATKNDGATTASASSNSNSASTSSVPSASSPSRSLDSTPTIRVLGEPAPSVLYSFAMDQHGSRFIQQRLESDERAEIDLAFEELLPYTLPLSTCVFGNYVIQKLAHHCAFTQQRAIFAKIQSDILSLSFHMYGCRVVQKFLQLFESHQELQQQIFQQLHSHVLDCIRDANANHVIQRCIAHSKQNSFAFIFHELYYDPNAPHSHGSHGKSNPLVNIAMHPYGCRVIQRLLEFMDNHSADKNKLFHTLFVNSIELSKSNYGNYVIQHILTNGPAEGRENIIRSFKQQINVLAKHKFASNVLEKAITHANTVERATIIEEMIGENDAAVTATSTSTASPSSSCPLLHLANDAYGNFVLQSALSHAQPDQLMRMQHILSPHIEKLNPNVKMRVKKILAGNTNPTNGSTPANHVHTNTSVTLNPEGMMIFDQPGSEHHDQHTTDI